MILQIKSIWCKALACPSKTFLSVYAAQMCLLHVLGGLGAVPAGICAVPCLP